MSNNFCQGSQFSGDHRYNNKKNPVQELTQFLQANNVHGYSDNNNYQFRDNQNYYRHPNQDYYQSNDYEMQMHTSAQNYAQMQVQLHNQNEDFSNDYGFNQASGQNCAPDIMSANNQYNGNYNMPNQQESYQYFQNNSLANQSNNLSTPNYEYNAPADYNYDKGHTNNTYEIQRNNSPEYSPACSNDKSNDNKLLNSDCSRNNLKEEDSKKRDLTNDFIHEPNQEAKFYPSEETNCYPNQTLNCMNSVHNNPDCKSARMDTYMQNGQGMGK